MSESVGERRRAYGLVVVAAFAYACLMFVWFSLPAYLAPIIEEIGLTSTEAGALVGAVPLTYVPLALFSGLAVDRVGPGRSLAAGVLVFGVAQIGRSAAQGFPSLLACTLLIGVGATAVTFGLPKLVSVLFPSDETGPASSIYLVGASAGSAAVFGVGRPVLGPLLGGWRALFFWSGVVAVGYAAVWFAVARRAGIDDRTAAGRTEGGEAGDREVRDGEAEDASFSLASARRDLGLILTHRELQLIVVVGTMYLLVNHGVQGWLPTVLESRGLSADRAGQTTSLFVAAFAAGVLAVPVVADRYAVRRASLMACGSLVCLGVGGIVAGGVGLATFAGVVVAGVGAGGISPLVRAMPPELEGIGSRLTGTAVGFIFAVGEIGGFLGPVLVGSLHGVTGSFAPGLVLLGSGGLVVVLAGAALRRIEG